MDESIPPTPAVFFPTIDDAIAAQAQSCTLLVFSNKRENRESTRQALPELSDSRFHGEVQEALEKDVRRINVKGGSALLTTESVTLSL